MSNFSVRSGNITTAVKADLPTVLYIGSGVRFNPQEAKIQMTLPICYKWMITAHFVKNNFESVKWDDFFPDT